MSSASSASLASAALVRRMKPPLSPFASPAARARRAVGLGERRHARAQLLAQLGRADLLRDADVIVLRQEDEEAPGDRDLRRQPRALGADRILDHLHRQRLPFEDDALDRRRRHGAGRMVAARRPAVDEDVGNVQERGALEADLDERRLHPGQDARDLADVDVADPAALELALEMQLLHRAVLDDRDAGFLRRPVDEDVLHRVRQAGVGVLTHGWTSTPAHSSSAAVSCNGNPMIPV